MSNEPFERMRSFFGRLGSFEHRHEFLAAALLLLVIGFGVFSNTFHAAPHARAASGTNWAWSQNVGWISFDCANEGVCSTPGNYKVSEAANGTLYGYAWSDKVGWISFNDGTQPSSSPYPNELSGCPDGNCHAAISKGVVTGWALACGSFDSKTVCSGTQNKAGGWQGWIHLKSPGGGTPTYGVTQVPSSCNLAGFAWGGGNGSNNNANIGWVSFSCQNESVCGSANYQAAVADAGSGCSSQQTPTVALSAAPSPGWADATNPINIKNPGGTNDAALTLTASSGVAQCDPAYYSNTGVIQSVSIPLNGANQGTVTNAGASYVPFNFYIACYDSNNKLIPPPLGSSCNDPYTKTNGGQCSAWTSITVSGSGAGNACQISNFSANPALVQAGETPNLSWITGSACSGCWITGDDGSSYGSPSNTLSANSGSQTTNPISFTTTYTLTCSGKGTTDTRQISVIVQHIRER